MPLPLIPTILKLWLILRVFAGRDNLMLGTSLSRYMQLLGEEENVHTVYRGRDSICGFIANSHRDIRIRATEYTNDI